MNNSQYNKLKTISIKVGEIFKKIESGKLSDASLSEADSTLQKLRQEVTQLKVSFKQNRHEANNAEKLVKTASKAINDLTKARYI